MSDSSEIKPRRLATVKEACRYGRFGHTLCYQFINEGKIAAYKRGRQTLIDLDTVDDYHRSLPRVMPKAS